MKISTSIKGREEVHFEFELNSKEVLTQVRLTGIGGPDFLLKLEEWRSQLQGELKELPLPKGTDIASMLIREVILKAQGKWNFPYKETELCHCRAVLTETVDGAVLIGAHDAKTVSQWTSASTACGTCRPDVESIISYRLFLGN